MRPPPLAGLPMKEAVRRLKDGGYRFSAKGTGFVYRSCPLAGAYEEGDTVFIVGEDKKDSPICTRAWIQRRIAND